MKLSSGFAFNQAIARKCSTQFLDSNWEDIENIALLVLFRTTRITLHCPIRGSSPSNCCWMGCRRYSAASRLEVLLQEDDFRSFWRALERGNVLLLSQLHVTIQILWSQCRAPPPLRVSPFLFDLLLQYLKASTRNFVWILVHLRVSPFLLSNLTSSWPKPDIFLKYSRWTVVHPRVSPFLIIRLLVLVGFVGYLCCFQRLLNPIFHPIIFE